MNMIQIPIVNKSRHALPEYATEQSAGMDLRANIDADYRGEIKVILVNLSAEPFTINDGDRIAQMVIARHETIAWQPATELSETERGTGGFGHSGV